MQCLLRPALSTRRACRSTLGTALRVPHMTSARGSLVLLNLRRTMATVQHDENRLPPTLKPLHYDVVVVTDLEKRSFGGVVSVDLEVGQDTSDIVLNAKDLNLSSATLQFTSSSKVISQSSLTTDAAKSRVSISFPETLTKGDKVRLRLPYSAALTDSMTGYYWSPYEFNGEKKICSLTQFEPIDARRAFPCWDEPSLKATYAITMISRADTVNLSNMPAISEGPYAGNTFDDSDAELLGDLFTQLKDSEWKITKFQTTPKISSYIIAYANGDFKYHEGSYHSKIDGTTRPMRVYTTPDSIHLSKFALEVKERAMPVYEDLFKVAYPLPKLDTLIVANFDAGAMENWGLITGRSAIYLYDENKSDLKSKKQLVETQSHECAHMWFGNIVTMAWWDNLWLNEGFASLMGEVVIMERLHPEWKPNTEFINKHLSRALRLDAKRSSHEIEVPIGDAEEINQLFDALTYSKAASMLRMLVSVVGEEKFLEGVTAYLNKHLYGNTYAKDLWDAIAEKTAFDVPNLMHNWVNKIGYPVLTVTENPNGITVRQDRFLDTGDVKEEENATVWHVPLQLLTTDASGKKSVDSSLILRDREANIALDTSCTWKLNADTNGVYRVNYEPERWVKLSEEIAREGSSFTVDDRMGLVMDSFALAQAGNLSKTSAALDVLTALKNEKEHLVWMTAAESLVSLISVWWEQEEQRLQLNALRVRLFKPLVDRLGFDFKSSDDVDTTQLRALAISQAAHGGDKEVLERLQEIYRKFVESGDDSVIPVNILRTVLVLAVRHGGETEHEHMKKIYLTPACAPTLKLGAIAALCSAKEQKLIDSTFAFLLESVENQDWFYFYRDLGGNRATRRILANYTMDNFEQLREKFEKSSTWASLIEYSIMSLTTEEDLNKIETFFASKNRLKFGKRYDQGLDAIRVSIGWLKRSKEDVAAWLKAHSA